MPGAGSALTGDLTLMGFNTRASFERRPPSIFRVIAGLSVGLALLAALAGHKPWASSDRADPARTNPPAGGSLRLRVLIVSGGPDRDYNQYAIESNARYLESLTCGARRQRILFADGNRASQTINTLEPPSDAEPQAAFDWMFHDLPSGENVIYRATTLHQLDGPSTRPSITRDIRALAHEIRPGETGLLYFTGHGSPGTKPVWNGKSYDNSDDYDNTLYCLWGDKNLSVRQLGRALRVWPASSPLMLVMVQCYSGGFGNLLFEDGDPDRPPWNRDFSGFFATSCDREASGCTSEVNERDYQDFTTHFFAALSGRTRDGRTVTGADLDGDGHVSPLEALAWANLHDQSIDVPNCTSDAYLRHIFPNEEGNEAWLATPYSQILTAGQPWQRATLEGLSGQLGLRGQDRIKTADAGDNLLNQQISQNDAQNDTPPATVPLSPDLSSGVNAATKYLYPRIIWHYPGVLLPHITGTYQSARESAVAWIAAQPVALDPVVQAEALRENAVDQIETREALYARFLHAAFTLHLEAMLAKSGTKAQQETFWRIRLAESRNPLETGKNY